MEISKAMKRVAAVVGLGAMGLLSGDTAEAALPFQETAGMNITVSVTGTCTLATVPAFAWTWDYVTPANNQNTQTLGITCSGPVPWEIYFDGGATGLYRAGDGGTEWLGYSATPSASSGAGTTNVSITVAADGTTSNGSAVPSNGTYQDILGVDLHY